ncbi:hypothetical protein ACOMHN_004374 [Nucella lapillus]
MTTTTTTTITSDDYNFPHFQDAGVNGSWDGNINNISGSNSSISANTTGAYRGRNEGLAVFEVAISATILFLAVTGNSVVVALLMLKRGKLSRMHLMMLHLSLADLSVAFFQVLPQMVWDITFRFQGGAFMCGAVKYLQLVTMYGSSYVLLSMALDRYLAICRPFLTHSWGSRQAHLLVLTAWTFALLFSLPQVFIFSLMEAEEGVYDCWATFDPPWTLTLYVTWNVLSVFLAPSLILAALYGLISYTVWKTSSMEETLSPSVFLAPSLILAALYGLISYTVWKTSSMEETLAPRYIPQHPHPIDNHQTPLPPSSTCLTKQPQDTPPQYSATSPLTTCPGGLAESVWTEGSCQDVGSGKRTSTDLHNGNPSRQNDQLQMVQMSSTSDPHERKPNSSRPVGRRGRGGGRGRGGKGPEGISRAKMKTIKLTLTVVLVYMICWTPFYVAQLWAAYDEDVSYDMCGHFATVYASFMLKRARFSLAMRMSILRLRTRADGVTVGVLLTLLYYGNLIHRCGDVELNPGPDRKTDGTRQTLLDSVTGGTTQRHSSRSRSRKDSSRKDSVERTGSTTETLTGLPSDPSLSDVMSMLTNLCRIFFTLVLLLASVNSCTNPWIYLAFSDTLWNTLSATLRHVTCCFRFRRNRNHSPRGGGVGDATCSSQTATTHALCSLGSFRTTATGAAAVNGDSML